MRTVLGNDEEMMKIQMLHISSSVPFCLSSRRSGSPFIYVNPFRAYSADEVTKAHVCVQPQGDFSMDLFFQFIVEDNKFLLVFPVVIHNHNASHYLVPQSNGLAGLQLKNKDTCFHFSFFFQFHNFPFFMPSRHHRAEKTRLLEGLFLSHRIIRIPS
jgi:hypothetical protein